MLPKQLMEALTVLGLGPYPSIKYHDFMTFYDQDGSGSIDLVEFSDLVWHEKRIRDDTAPKRSFLRQGKEGVSERAVVWHDAMPYSSK